MAQKEGGKEKKSVGTERLHRLCTLRSSQKEGGKRKIKKVFEDREAAQTVYLKVWSAQTKHNLV